MQIDSLDIKNQSFHTGNEKILSELFELFFARACSFATSIIDDKQLAYDIVQEVFISIWKKNIKCTSIMGFKVYLYNSVRNACFNHLKRNVSPTKTASAYEETEDSAENILISAEIESEIFKQINMLPEARKNIVLMKLEGMTLEEIAKKLGLSINTIKTHKKLANRQLKENLKDLYIFLL